MGRVAAPAAARVLPSGDELVELRVVVDRPATRTRGEGRAPATVDAIDVTCWSARTRRRALALAVDDLCRVEGPLRRRFFRTPAGAASRYTVEAEQLVRVRPERQP